MSDTGVRVSIVNTKGEELGSFEGNNTQSFSQMAAKHGIEIPTSCCAGACFVCCARILQWQDAIQIDKLSLPLVDVENNPDGSPREVLTCIGGIKPDCFRDGKFHHIVLQKML